MGATPCWRSGWSGGISSRDWGEFHIEAIWELFPQKPRQHKYRQGLFLKTHLYMYRLAQFMEP